MPKLTKPKVAAAAAAKPAAALIADAPRAMSISSQKYLIDTDGNPLPFNQDVYNQNPHLRVVSALPTSYVRRVREHVAHQHAAHSAQAAQIAELEQARLSGIDRQRQRDAALREAALSNAGSDAAEQDLNSAISPDAFVIGDATAAQLVDFAKANYAVDLDESLPLAELRAEVAMLAGLDPAGEA